MVASKKWIKSVLGLQKGNKLQSSEQDENSSGSTDESWLQGKGSDETASSVIEKQPNPNAVLEAEGAKDATAQSVNHSDEVDSGIIDNEMAPSVITEVEDAENSKFLPMKHSGENNSGIFDKQSDPNVGADINYAKGSHSVLNPASPISRTLVTNIHDPYDTTLQSLLNSASSSSTSLCEKNADQLQQNVREEREATRIQGAFRRFLARRRLRALRGLVRLQALVTGRAVRKQASFTLHSMQDLVRVQVRARARRVRTGFENQIVQHKLHQQFEQEQEARVKQEDEARVKVTGVKEIGGGWCGSAGSAEEIKARSLKRKEAAAKREKAMAYALARQWQASSRNRAKPASVGQDKICWSWNWWDTWMGSSQLENRVVDINLEDRTTPSGNEPSDAQQKPVTRSTSAGKKAAADVGSSKSVCSSGLKPGITQELKAASSHCSSPIKSANLRETLSPHTPSRSPRSVVRDSGEVSSPRLLGARSRSTPKERSPLGDNNTGKKRLSLPETGQSAKHQFSQPAVQRSIAAPKHMKARSKSTGSEP